MPHEWFYTKGNTSYGPVSAKALKELADSGQLDAHDQVGCLNEWVTADKLDGLLGPAVPQATTVQIIWAGQWMLFDASVAVRLDGQPVGQGSFKKGFRFVVETDPGQHTLGVKLPLRGEKQIVIDLPDVQCYGVELVYNAVWGTFGDCTIRPLSMEGAVVIQQWERERQAACCSQCGAEWAVEFLGEKHVKTEHLPQTITQTEDLHYENPNYGQPLPLRGGIPDERRHLEAQARKQVQVQVAHETWHLFFQCSRCNRKWKRKDVRTYVP